MDLTDDEVRAGRWRSQGLTGQPSAPQVDEVVAQAGAIQAQDEAAAAVGVWARGRHLTRADVRAAVEQRSIVRTWALRGTLHYLPASDVRWLLNLLRPALSQANRLRRQALGLDDERTAAAVRVVVDALQHAGPLSRAEVASRLASAGLPSQGQATIHVLWRAALDGLICCGPQVSGQAMFVSLADWLPDTLLLDREAALAALARRFIRAYGPATPQDLAAWSGLSSKDARQAWQLIAGDVHEVATTLGPMWVAEPFEPAASLAGARLLPAFDGLWLGYASRSLMVSAAEWRALYPGGGIIRPAVLVDGRLAGTWGRTLRPAMLSVAVDALGCDHQELTAKLAGETAALGRFFDRREVRWTIATASV